MTAKSDGYGGAVAKALKAAIDQNGYESVVGPTSAFGKDVIARVGGLADSQPITDVIEIQDKGAKFLRPIYAGNAIATVSTVDKLKLLTIRATNFEGVAKGDANSYETQEVSGFEGAKGKVTKNDITESEMVDLTAASIVISGGRGMKNGENFKMLYDLAEKIGKGKCSVGASRAAVDAGFVPNDLQVGQTGKVVAPDLYVAVGISGAI